MHSAEEAATAYLQQIQPRDLADLMTHVQHDMQMLLGSYAAYFELLETQLKSIVFADELVSTYCSSGLQGGIGRLRTLLNSYPDFHALQLQDVHLLKEWWLVTVHDLRSPVGLFVGWADVLQYEFKEMPSSSSLTRLQHLNQAMQLTADRMYVITSACARFKLVERE